MNRLKNYYRNQTVEFRKQPDEIIIIDDDEPVEVIIVDEEEN